MTNATVKIKDAFLQCMHKATWEEAGPDYLTGITTIILQILTTTKHLWGRHLLPSGHENFHDDSVVVTLWMFPGLSVRKSGPVARQVSYAISLWYCRVTTVWLKWPISFYSGKDLCTEGKLQLLLYSTRATLPTLPIDVSQGTNIASSLKTMSQLQFW